MNKCLDCGKKIYKYSQRCIVCRNRYIAKIRNKDMYRNKKRNYKISLATKNRLKNPKNHPNYKGNKAKIKQKYYCINCNKKINFQSALYGQGRCYSCANLRERNPAWNNGSSFEPYPLGWTKTFKEQIRFRDNYKCQLCGCPEIENIRKLDIRHIDYNKKNLKLNNLISLCLSCHMKTNYNRDYWRNYFENKITS